MQTIPEKVTHQQYWVVQATATLTKTAYTEPEKVGTPITVYVSFTRGMTDSGQPGWSTMSPTKYSTYETAVEWAKGATTWLGTRGWNFENVRDVKVIYHQYITRETHKSYEEPLSP
jgi:hypothetical protein